MKKIAAVLLVLVFSAFDPALAQRSKKVKAEEPDDGIKFQNLKIYVSALPGFQIYTTDSAKVTFALPYGINYRRYCRTLERSFWDMDLCAFTIVLNGNEYTTFAKVSAGFGMIGRERPLNFQLHLNYAHSFLKYGDMIGFGYDLESNSIPITLDFLKRLGSKESLVLVGIKVPIFQSSFNRPREILPGMFRL